MLGFSSELPASGLVARSKDFASRRYFACAACMHAYFLPPLPFVYGRGLGRGCLQRWHDAKTVSIFVAKATAACGCETGVQFCGPAFPDTLSPPSPIDKMGEGVRMGGYCVWVAAA